jgi:sortase A
MKKKISNILLVLLFFLGLSLLLYPTVSDYWNYLHQSRAIAEYTGSVTELDQETYTTLWESAKAYNEKLLTRTNRFFLTDEEWDEYEQELNIRQDGIMGYVDIPSINVSLPIYHGTEENVLQVGVGHIEGSSLPVGGEGTHCVISGHRGLPTAKLFTNLDRLVEGDYFMLQVLDQTLTYEVDQILIIEPEDLEPLAIEEGKDYCTLVTCTPYGINTHRLLVRGHRVQNPDAETDIRVSADALQIDPVTVALCLAIPVLTILMILIVMHPAGKHPKKKSGKS